MLFFLHDVVVDVRLEIVGRRRVKQHLDGDVQRKRSVTVDAEKNALFVRRQRQSRHGRRLFVENPPGLGFERNPKGHENWPVMGITKGTSVPATGTDGWTFHELTDGGDLVQPTCMRLPKDMSETRCFFRDRRAKNIWYATSKDGGATFDKPATTVLPNNNAGIEGYPLESGNIALVFNPQTAGRDPIAIGLSPDGGLSWPHQRLLQHGVSIDKKEEDEQDEANGPITVARKLLATRGGIRGSNVAQKTTKNKNKNKKKRKKKKKKKKYLCTH